MSDSQAEDRPWSPVDEEYFQHPSSGRRVTYTAIREAIAKTGQQFFPMTLTSSDEINAVIKAVNQGIDSHLDACNCPSLGDAYRHGHRAVNGKVICTTLECRVSAASLPVLLRRLTEIPYDEDDEAASLVASILYVLGFDDCGNYIGPQDG